MNKSIASTQEQKNKRYSVKKPSIAHFFVSQSRLTDAVSVIFGELLSYEHPPKERNLFAMNLSIVQGLSFDRFIMPQPQLMFKICGLEKSGDGAIIQAKIFMEGFL